MLNRPMMSPVVQFLRFKVKENDRVLCMVSDGIQCTFAFLTKQALEMYKSNQVIENSVVKINKWECTTLKGGRILPVIYEYEVVELNCDVLGDPQPWGKDGSNQNEENANPNTNNMNNNNNNNNSNNNNSNKNNNNNMNNMNNTNTPTKPVNKRLNNVSDNNNGGSPMGNRFMPINALNPYQSRWTLKARVTNKHDLRRWQNDKGEGIVGSFILTDASGDVKCTSFGEIAEKLYSTLELGKVYLFKKGNVKAIKNRQYNKTTCDYEIMFDKNVEFELCDDNSDSSVPDVRYTFTPIGDLEGVGVGETVDIIGVCTEMDELVTINTKRGPAPKLTMTLVDDSEAAIKLTIWGATAESFNNNSSLTYPVVACKSVRIGDYGGCSLSTTTDSLITANPDINDAHHLRGWYDNVGVKKEARALTGSKSSNVNNFLKDRKMLSWIKEQNATGLHKDTKTTYFTARGFITKAKDQNALYKACPKETCKKKMTERDEGSGEYYCEKCSETYYNCKHCLILQVSVTDASGSIWSSIFGEDGEKLMGYEAEELYNLLQQGNQKRYEDAFKAVEYKPMVFKLATKVNEYQGDMRLRTSILSCGPLDYLAESRLMLTEIEQMMGCKI